MVNMFEDMKSIMTEYNYNTTISSLVAWAQQIRILNITLSVYFERLRNFAIYTALKSFIIIFNLC